MAKKRKPLEAWQKQDAERLKKIFDARPEPQTSQAAFAMDNGIGTTQGAVWQYVNGVIPLNMLVAAKFAKGLGCNVRDFSPRLADQIDALMALYGDRSFSYDVPQDQADELLAYFEQFSPRHRELLLKKLREAIEENERVMGAIPVEQKVRAS
jgi:transcriptional regulator with XRE-family HTH domain